MTERTGWLARHLRQSGRFVLRLLLAWLGIASGIGVIVLLVGWLDDISQLMLIGSLGATAVLLFGAPQSPFAQPRNLLLGQAISVLAGIFAVMLFPDSLLLAAPFAVATATVVMMLSANVHPPGGATALIAVIGPPEIQALGFGYLLPVMASMIILLLVALVTNNLLPGERYPQRWL